MKIPRLEQAQKRIIFPLQNDESGQMFDEIEKKPTKSITLTFFVNLPPHEYILGKDGQSQYFKTADCQAKATRKYPNEAGRAMTMLGDPCGRGLPGFQKLGTGKK